MATALVSIPIALPLISIAVMAATPALAMWQHLFATVLFTYVMQTLILLAGVGFFTFVIGVTMAWLVTLHVFPFSRLLQWMALLPLAMPGYIVAFTYVDFFNYAGPVQTALRQITRWQKPGDYWFPEIRSLGGAIFVLSMVLYPYVYVSARAAFMKQHLSQLDVARTLGRTAWQVFTSIVLPQARPAIVVGVTLVMMECLNDIAAVSFFGVQTLTLGVYSTWLGQGDLRAAAQLAFVMLVCVAGLIVLERRSRGKDRFLRAAQKPKPIQQKPLRGIRQWLAVLMMLFPIGLGFMLPAVLLILHALRRLDQIVGRDFLNALAHSFLLAGLACVTTLLAGLVLVYANRLWASKPVYNLTLLATLGYAVPGTVLGIGLLVPLGKLDNAIHGVMLNFGVSTGLIFSGSIAALVLAYTARFMMMSFGALDAGLTKISPQIDDVARTLGRKPLTIVKDIHIPLMRPALLSAALLVFVDAMKELPATLILRPFDFDTLATHVFTLASLDKLGESAVPSLAIVVAGLLPVILLSRSLQRSL